MAVGGSEEIHSITLYHLLPTWFHGYILPFVILYVSLASGWIYVFGDLHREALFISMAVVGALNVMACLFCVWSVHVRCLLTCRKVSLVMKLNKLKKDSYIFGSLNYNN